MDESQAEAPSAPTVTATPNGPFHVKGIRRIVWREVVETLGGEPIAWRERGVVAEADQEYWLCRCGQSANKPFCDNSHRTAGFNAVDAADPGPRSERKKDHGAGQVTLEDDRGLCVNTGFCGNKITNAWKLAARDDLDTAGATQLIAMTEHCPSGAISTRVAAGDLESTRPTEVVLIPDGPLWVTGGVTVERSDGVQLETRNRVTLCRCGASKNKPLCDGSHIETGFKHSP
ncbi:MAG: CDGSH iron-sulfur domain-containing protein [Actinomycetia bacterium]|nr:CDGSH iron-sulfur domain-containing protein [Actinomycetes bacterium]